MLGGRRFRRQEEDRCGSKERRRAVGGGWPGWWQLLAAVMFLVVAFATDESDDDHHLDKLALCVVGRVEEGPALALALQTVLRALPGDSFSVRSTPLDLSSSI